MHRNGSEQLVDVDIKLFVESVLVESVLVDEVIELQFKFFREIFLGLICGIKPRNLKSLK